MLLLCTKIDEQPKVYPFQTIHKLMSNFVLSLECHVLLESDWLCVAHNSRHEKSIAQIKFNLEFARLSSQWVQ
jgi:hypothetical protein